MNRKCDPFHAVVYALEHPDFELDWRVEKPNRHSVEVLVLKSRDRHTGQQRGPVKICREDALFASDQSQFIRDIIIKVYGKYGPCVRQKKAHQLNVCELCGKSDPGLLCAAGHEIVTSLKHGEQYKVTMVIRKMDLMGKVQLCSNCCTDVIMLALNKIRSKQKNQA